MSAVYVMAQAGVTALGASLGAMWPRLCAGESAIAPITRFDTSRLDFHSAACLPDLDPTGFPNRTCALLARLTGSADVPSAFAPAPQHAISSTHSSLPTNWERGRPRPLSPSPSSFALPFANSDPTFERSSLECGSLLPLAPAPANAIAGSDHWPALSLPPSTFVIWAGVKGDAEWIEQRAAAKQIPPEGGTPERDASADFYTPAHYRRWLCERLGLSGAGMEVNAACASSTAALALGAMMIERGEADSVLVCAADIVSRFTFMGFAALRGLSPTVCRPLDQARDGLCLGDGAAAILMMGERLARESQLTPRARLAGWGIANDATHITAPARDGCGLTAAIRAALARAQAAPDSIDAFCVHGTGTVYNDAMELTALETVFGGRRFPVFSIKGAIGHTLGAAGALEAAVCVQSLHTGLVPPTAGLCEPEPRAGGRASHLPQTIAGQRILTTNSGFGGINAALVFEKV